MLSQPKMAFIQNLAFGCLTSATNECLVRVRQPKVKPCNLLLRLLLVEEPPTLPCWPDVFEEIGVPTIIHVCWDAQTFSTQ